MDIHAEVIVEFEKEAATTRNILAAIPENADFAYKPHAKSMSLGRLASHLAETSGQWACGTLTKEKVELPADFKFERQVATKKETLLAEFDKGVAETKAALKAFSPAKWDDNWSFGMGGQVWISDTKYRSHVGAESPGASSRPVGRLSAPAQCAAAGKLWAFGGQ